MSEDLSKRIQELEKTVRQKRNAAQAGLFLSVIVVVITAGWLFMHHTMDGGPKAGEGQVVVSSDSLRNMTYTIKEQTNDIESQKTEIEALKMQLESLVSDSLETEDFEEMQDEAFKEAVVNEPKESNVVKAEVSNSETHIVLAGESLWSIAVQHFGDGSKFKDITTTNNISDINQIVAGETLQLR